MDRVVSDSTGRLSSVFVGGVYPLFRGASNRVLLAFASSQFQSNYLNSLELAEEEKIVCSILNLEKIKIRYLKLLWD